MKVLRHTSSADVRVPYDRMATAEADMRDLLHEHGIQTPVRAAWTPASDRDVMLEVWANGRAVLVRP